MSRYRPLLAITALLAFVGASAHAADAYHVFVPLKVRLTSNGENAEKPPQGNEPLTLSLQSSVLGEATKGSAYSFDFSSLLSAEGTGAEDLKPEDIAWARASGGFPAGLTLTGATLSGTPLEINAGASFEIIASFKDAVAQQVYTIKVGKSVFNVKYLHAGQSHSCAISIDGDVYCWGLNSGGQLGDRTTTNSSTPVAVIGLNAKAAALAGGQSHTCALTEKGSVYCWGQNGFGQLGTGTYQSSYGPAAVQGMSSGVSAISAGTAHTCALTTAGAAYCWGLNVRGELGDGTAQGRPSPVAVSGLGTGVAKISVGYSHTCAVTTTGDAYCWGDNDAGQLGGGSTGQTLNRIKVTGLSDGVSAISAGNRFTCAITTKGAAYCWGFNNPGQLGNGTTSSSSIPVAVVGLGSGMKTVSTGGAQTCATTTAGAAYCWGLNNYGQLGDGTTKNSMTPVAVIGLNAGAVSITSGSSHTCAFTSGQAAYCWGINANGQLGAGTGANKSLPTEVQGVQ